jgi:hypothetical protein
MVSESSTIDTAVSSTPRKRSAACFGWSRVSRSDLPRIKEAMLISLRYFLVFEKANEIYFRLGIIYKQQHKYPSSLDVRFFPPLPFLQLEQRLIRFLSILSLSTLVLPLHSQGSTSSVDRGRHLVSDRSRSRVSEGGTLSSLVPSASRLFVR